MQCLSAFDLDFDLKSGLELAAQSLPIAVTPESLQASLDFIVGRLKNSLTDQGFRYDVVDAVLAEQHTNPAGVIRAVQRIERLGEPC